MKRRIQGLFMALVMMLSLVPTVAFASETVAGGTCGAEGDNLTWTLDDAGTLTISGTGAMADYTNPYDEDPIHPQWYDCRNGITQVVVEDGVTSIGVYAFDGIDLRDISLPNSVTEIGAHAFDNCYCLGEIIIPNTATSIGEYAFAGCNGLNSVTIPESVTFIGNGAFAGCASLTQIVVSDANPNFCNDDNGVLFNKDKTELMQCPNAFSGAYTIPDSVTVIDDRAFDGCSSLTAITIPGSVESIGSYLFWGCNSLTSVTICNGVMSIGRSAFAYCGALTDVTIPDSVTYIGDGAFSGCNSLTNVEIPNSVTGIDNEAFRGCNSLMNVEIPNSVTSIGSGAFRECNSLTSVEIPDSVTSIGSGAFKNCNSLAEVSISEAMLANIDAADVFGGTLWYINNYGVGGSCGDDLTWNLNGNGVLTIAGSGTMDDYVVRFDADEEICPPWWNYSNAITQVVIEDGVTYIGEGAFGYEYEEDDRASYPNLTTVSFPDSLTEIGAYAFAYCQNLTDITLPAHLEKIGGAAFANCNGLHDVSIPASVTDLATGAFSSCDNLTAIHIAEDNEVYSSIEGVVFNKDATELIRCPAGYSGEYIVPNGVTRIGNGAFFFCQNLTGVTIPDSVTSIGDAAFYCCTSIHAMTIGNGVERIERSAFQNCDGLTSVVIPENVAYVGEYAFAYCENLRSVSYSEDTEVEETAFEGTPWYEGNPGGGDEPTPEEFTISGTVYMGENQIAIPDGGQVFYSFTPQESGLYLFTSGDVEDTYAQLLDENYDIVAEDDDSGDANNFLITYNLETGKTYYIGVKYLNGQAGTIAVYIERHEHEFGNYSHIYQWDDEKGEDVDIGHAAYCETCGCQMSDVEPHNFDGNRCTVCGAVDPNHEHVFGHYGTVYQWDEEKCEDVNIGHAAYCDICGCQMGDVEPHEFQDNHCTVCGAVDPNHEHVFGHYDTIWHWDEEKCESFDIGHAAYCNICGEMMGDIESHNFDGNYCTMCGAVNPDHECVAEEGWSHGEGYGHYKLCTICGRLVGDEYDHTYENGRCTVCGAVDPDHEHVFGYYGRIWQWNEETDEEVDAGHAAYCAICNRQMSDIESHDFADNYCTLCGAIDPNHAHEDGKWYPSEQGDGHYLACRICGARMSGDEAHSYEHGRCTVCGAASADHVHSYRCFDMGSGSHCSYCTICYDRQLEGEHTYDSNGVCTACGYERDSVAPDAISIRNGENKELIITLTYADGTSRDMTVQGFDFYRGGGSSDGWINGTGCIYTDAGRLGFGYFFEWHEDGRLYVRYGFRGDKDSNVLDSCEWFTVYRAAQNENITDFTLNYSDGVWTAVGKAYDGLDVTMTLDGNGNVLTYEIGTSGGDIAPDLLGDVNDDGKVNQKDVARLRQYIGDSTDYPLNASQNADVNNDGRVNQKDVARLRQYIGDPATYPLG